MVETLRRHRLSSGWVKAVPHQGGLPVPGYPPQRCSDSPPATQVGAPHRRPALIAGTRGRALRHRVAYRQEVGGPLPRGGASGMADRSSRPHRQTFRRSPVRSPAPTVRSYRLQSDNNNRFCENPPTPLPGWGCRRLVDASRAIMSLCPSAVRSPTPTSDPLRRMDRLLPRRDRAGRRLLRDGSGAIAIGGHEQRCPGRRHRSGRPLQQSGPSRSSRAPTTGRSSPP